VRALSVRAVVTAVIGVVAAIAPSARAGVFPEGGEHVTVMYVVPAASASNSAGDTIRGGCFFLTVNDPTTMGNNYQGITGDFFTATDAAGNQTFAKLKCSITVNGVSVVTWGTNGFYSANDAEADPNAFNATVHDVVELCQYVTFIDGTTLNRCTIASTATAPPRVDVVLVHQLFVQDIDPVLCPVLVQLGQITGGGIGGVVYIAADGDVDVPALGPAMREVYDCPPYIVP